MPSRRSTLAAIVGAALAPRTAFAQAQQTAVLYTSNNVEAVQTAIETIRQRAASLSIQQVTGGTGVLMRRMEAEKDNPGGDVFWSGGFGTLGAFKPLFQSYDSPEAVTIPESLRGPANLWTGSNVHIMVIMVNASRLAGLSPPKTWSDLFHERWMGKVAITDPGGSSASYIQIYGIFQQFGHEGLQKLARNAVITKSTGATYKGVGDGEFAVGVTMEYAAYEYVDAGKRDVSIVYPAEGTYFSPEGMVLIKGGKNPEAGRRLFDALLSKDVQEALLKSSFRRPSRSDIKVSEIVRLPERSAVNVVDIDQSLAATEYDKIIRLWNAAVADAKRG
jgi:iron(III) transport system substrate-binding protein